MVSMLDSSLPWIRVAKLTCALTAVAIAHVACTFFLYRARVLTHSSLASSNFVLFALPTILAFIGYLLLLRARAVRMIPPWAAACLLVFLSFWVSLILAFDTYGT